jgi:DNA modification methylase
MKITAYNFKKEHPNEEDRLRIYKENLIIDGEYKRVVPLDQLFVWDENPKKSTVQDMKRLENMTTKLGQFKSLVVEESGQVLGGNHRKAKWEAMGFKFTTIEVVYPKTEDERMEYALADNDHIAEYDQEALAEKLKLLKNVDLEMFRVNLAPLSKLSMLLDKYADPPKEDEVPPLPTVAVSRTGELYQLGKHRLYCGDSTKAESYKILMDGKRAKMVFTDPPYNIDYKGQPGEKREGIMNDNMTADQFRQFLTDCLTEMMKVNDGAFYICMSPQELYNLHPAFVTAGGHFQSYIIWVKNTFNISGADFQSMYEPILYGWNKDKERYFAGYRDEANVWTNLEAVKPRYEDGMTTITLGLYTLKIKGQVEGEVLRKRDSVDIWEVPKTVKNSEHPTMKPVKLVSKALRASSERGDLVLDPFGGSGSTLIAAEETNRICNMMELDPRYVDVIIKRWEKLTGEQAIKLQEAPAENK